VTTGETTSEWQAIGGREGGTVSALAFSPAYPRDQTVFAATLAGVHRSTDAGHSWQSVSQGLPNPFVDAIVISPNFVVDGILFAGGREAGVSRSGDRGESWQPLSFWDASPPSIAALAISPAFAEDQTLFAGSEEGLVYRSTNAGRSWEGRPIGLPAGEAVLALTVGPTYQAGGPVWAATSAGLFISEDSGINWRPVGLTDQVCQALLLSSSFELDGTLFVGTEQAGLLRSRDGGASWMPVNEGLGDPCINGLAISPTFMLDGIVLAATANGIYRSEDSGGQWQLVGDVGSVLSIAVLPPDALSIVDPTIIDETVLTHYRTVLAGTAHGGIVRSLDGGGSWQPASQGLNARLVVSLALSPDFARDRTLYSCSLEEGIHRSDDDGASWQASNVGLPALEVAGLALSPAFAEDRTLVAATAGGVAISRNGGESWLATGGPTPAQAIAVAPDYRRLGGLLAAGSDGSLRLSSDSGLTWRSLPVPFIGQEVAMVAFSPGFAEDGMLFAATTQATGPGGTGQASVWQSTDRGESWQTVLIERDEGRWLSLAIPPTFSDDGAFYIGLGDRVLRPMRRASERRLGGQRPIWIGEHLGNARTVVVGLALSPAYRFDQTLFAATSAGVFVSRNAGLSWRPLAAGMIDRSIVAVVPTPTYADDRTVYAASLGGTIWRLVDALR
jgi:photosystem II stability/assembly factor-like uncharacterized protein